MFTYLGLAVGGLAAFAYVVVFGIGGHLPSSGVLNAMLLVGAGGCAGLMVTYIGALIRRHINRRLSQHDGTPTRSDTQL